MSGNFKSEVVVGVSTALVLAGLTLVWNKMTDGGFAHAIGAITRDQITEAGFIPRGAILAFEISPSSDLECPPGWKSHRPSRGRVLIGAGEHSNRDMNGRVLSSYGMGDNGGEESHLINISEMPNHSHEIRDMGGEPIKFRTVEFGAGGGKNQIWDISGEKFPDAYVASEIGGGEEKNNLPPFYAILYCEKE